MKDEIRKSLISFTHNRGLQIIKIYIDNKKNIKAETKTFDGRPYTLEYSNKFNDWFFTK